ncbi:unnamed protein product [Peronospora belbahrii]|uniref:Rap-GAP domain-containing protein n=1 Tax=Peronospora belbahrii TaxID=622444 RepID=A0AAU9KWF8_9STRA|nr:unnamed protein product [Peronospora belbahrii]
MDSSKRILGETKTPRKETTCTDIKRLAKFFASDRPPRKRLRTLLDYIKHPPGTETTLNTTGNIAVAMQSLLSGTTSSSSSAASSSTSTSSAFKDFNHLNGGTHAQAEHAATIIEFWADEANSALVFSVVNDCVTELETLYAPHETAFRKQRRKPLEAEDWSEIFEGLEVLLRHNVMRLRDGWNNKGLTILFAKLLKKDNHAMIKKYAFRCLALYTDATRNLQQLAAMPVTSTSSFQVSRAGSIRLMSDDIDIGIHEDMMKKDEMGKSNATLLHAMPDRKTIHLELLRESVDFSPYGGGSIMLPDKFLNEGVHVEGWMRPMPTQAEEPVDMLKFLMDLSLERDDSYGKNATPLLMTGKSTGGNSDRFIFWAELIMKFYMPLLYPKAVFSELLHDGFTNCGRGKNTWKSFGHGFYSGICTGTQHVPSGMKVQINEVSRAMISHVSQLFHPSVQLEDSKILLHCIELLELVSQRRLDDYTSTYLRKFVLSTVDNCIMLREPGNRPVLTAMLSIVLHVWMHSAIVTKTIGAQVWMELTIAIRRWIGNPADLKVVGAEMINCWKRELRFASCLLMYVMDKGYSYLKVTPEGALLLSQHEAGGKSDKILGSGKSLRELKQGYLQSSANFLMMTVVDVSGATLLLDRVLHLIPPPTVSALTPSMHLNLTEGMLQLVELWIESAIGAQRAQPSDLQQISPSTVFALFGEWFLPACELDAVEFQNSRCIAIVALCKLCSVRCVNMLTRSHLTVVARVLFKGITSSSGVVVSTVLQKSSVLFSMNLEGLNILVPAYLYAVDEIIIGNIWNRATKSNVKSSEWNNELNAALDVVFAIVGLPKRFPNQDYVRWKHKIQGVCSVGELSLMQNIMEEIPDTLDDFHVIVGRILSYKTGEHVVDPIHLSGWVVHLVEVCQNVDFSISTTALTILQDMSDYHEEINGFDPSLVARIVMTLAVFAQQQVEEASIEVQSAMERIASAVRRGSDNPRASRVDSSSSGNPGEATDAFSKLKSKLKSGVQNAPSSTPSPTTISPATARSASLAAQREQDIPALRLIVQKTSAIFECLRFWIMHRTEVLQDTDVKKLIFGAIEAALVGTLPDGEWQREVERARTLERRMSMPLLFLGLQMRASLDNEPGHAWLKCFEETAVAAEGLLMHLLHHINGFPSPAGVDQMMSDCSELSELDALREIGDDEPRPGAMSFVFMDSIVFSVVGSLDSPCARFVVRDMTGLFTWEITPAVMARGAHSSTGWIGGDVAAASTANSKGAPVERELTLETDVLGTKSMTLHRPTGAVQVEFKRTDAVGGTCKTCGGEKVVTKPVVSDAKNVPNAIKLEARQVSWEHERDVLSNNVCPVKSSYVFHDDGHTPAGFKENGDAKKKDKSRSSEIDKMPVGGNKDDRQERLERIAKQHEDRNKLGSAVQPVPEPQKIMCHCPPQTESKFKRRTTTTICGLFDMSINEPNIGSLDDERCLLDLVLDSIPMIFRDCGGDTTDKTLLGGRYSMMRYNLMDLSPSSSPLLMDSAEAPGFSFLQRLIHDEECYSQLKHFLTKDDNAEGKELVDFCDAVKKYERSSVPTDRLGQACVIYWEFMTVDGGKKIVFPTAVATDIQAQIHQAQTALRAASTTPAEDSSEPTFFLPGSLFERAMIFVENEGFNKSGLLDKYVAALDQPPPASVTAGSGKSSSTPSIPPQLALFDAFSITEVNARVSHLALQKRNADEQLGRMTRPGKTAAERLLTTSNGSLKDSRVSALDICRLFLSQAGLLPSPDGESKKKSTLRLLEHGPKLERSLKHLDKSPTRETMKLGVIYVGKRQQTQQEILHNEKGSRAYELFLSQLGWKVDMQTHRGFVGGLDTNPKSLSNGKTTLYYASSHSEVVYHVVTMMPTKPSDPQQIDKKRHVGNDYVHIVWNDNASQSYDPSTITSHFNDVQIVIYPLRKAQRGLFLIKIHIKDKVPPFGPLQSGMVIHQADLARLVRQTAMNANRVCRSQTTLYVRPYPTRKKLVDEIVERDTVLNMVDETVDPRNTVMSSDLTTRTANNRSDTMTVTHSNDKRTEGSTIKTIWNEKGEESDRNYNENVELRTMKESRNQDEIPRTKSSGVAPEALVTKSSTKKTVATNDGTEAEARVNGEVSNVAPTIAPLFVRSSPTISISAPTPSPLISLPTQPPPTSAPTETPVEFSKSSDIKMTGLATTQAVDDAYSQQPGKPMPTAQTSSGLPDNDFINPETDMSGSISAGAVVIPSEKGNALPLTITATQAVQTGSADLPLVASSIVKTDEPTISPASFDSKSSNDTETLSSASGSGSTIKATIPGQVRVSPSVDVSLKEPLKVADTKNSSLFHSEGVTMEKEASNNKYFSTDCSKDGSRENSSSDITQRNDGVNSNLGGLLVRPGGVSDVNTSSASYYSLGTGSIFAIIGVVAGILGLLMVFVASSRKKSRVEDDESRLSLGNNMEMNSVARLSPTFMEDNMTSENGCNGTAFMAAVPSYQHDGTFSARTDTMDRGHTMAANHSRVISARSCVPSTRSFNGDIDTLNVRMSALYSSGSSMTSSSEVSGSWSSVLVSDTERYTSRNTRDTSLSAWSATNSSPFGSTAASGTSGKFGRTRPSTTD